MQVIGLDLGTTSICGVLIDTKTGAVLRSFTENSNAFLPGKAAWERIQSPQKIVAVALRILNELLNDQVVAIGVTGQMHGIVYTNAEGNAVSPLYTWQDGRGNLPYEGHTYAAHLHSNSGYGHVTDFYNTVNGLVPPKAEGYCTIHDYLVMYLCGLHRAPIHESDAASFGCYDLDKRSFSYACDMEIVSGFRVAGTYRGVPVSVAIGDNQASVFSCLADTNGILLNVGTGSQISVLSNRILSAEGIETRPYFEGNYLVVGAALCGGYAYALLKDFYARVLGYAVSVEDDQVYAMMERMLQSESSASLMVDTRFSGTRADEMLRGSVRGISTENFTPEALTHGVLEGIIEELHAMYRAMGVQRHGLVASGNGVRRNPALRQVAKRVFASTLSMPTHIEEAAYGAALYALVSCGYCKNAAEAQQLILMTTEE